MSDVKKIPLKVDQDTIVDAICEFKLNAKVDKFSQVILGVVYTALQGEKAISQSSATLFPEVVINAEPVFNFPQMSSISWNGYKITFTDSSFFIGCKIPYPRWIDFQSAILEVLGIVLRSQLVEQVVRYSLKYTDFIPATSTPPFKYVDLGLSLGGVDYSTSNVQLNLEIRENEILHLVGIANPAFAHNNKSPADQSPGVMISTDSIVMCSRVEHELYFGANNEAFIAALQRLHTVNKALFFNILSNDGLSVLRPSYG
jgi:uncharacterized protein (TIGR04255 family)